MTLSEALETTQPIPADELPAPASLDAGLHAGLGEPLDLVDRLRVEALLQIDELLDRGGRHEDRVVLADWMAEQITSGRRAAVLEAVGDVEALELSQAAIVELAAAHATFVEVAGQAQRIRQVAAIVRRGMTLTQSADLAATLQNEGAALEGRLEGILAKYPELAQLMSADVVARSASLQRPDGSPV